VKKIQQEQATWAFFNFGPHNSTHALLGVTEEVGELSHAHLKFLQGIRITPAQYEIKAKDAIGDIIIYLMDYCTANGWDLEDIVRDTWDTVKTRDWKTFPKNGVSE
jgi:NTP pyrophosphatase (non-canonical NTP hydrolase)